MKVERIYFSPNEAIAISMGLARVIEDLNEIKKGDNSNIPWTPEARKHQAEILNACQSAARKLEKFASIECKLPPYEPGDEDEFLTKQS